jgi:hypothetical protein
VLVHVPVWWLKGTGKGSCEFSIKLNRFTPHLKIK